MNNDKYSKAYREVIEIIKYFPEEEYNKIPKEKIDFFKENMDKDYEFSINPFIELSEQHISKEANAIILVLYEDYFATKEQKNKIREFLNSNQEKQEQEKLKKYNPNDIFKDERPIYNKKNHENKTETALVEYRNNFFENFINFIKKIFNRIK